MKKNILILNLLIATLCNAYGLDIAWQTNLEVGVDPSSYSFVCATGADGSLFVVYVDTLYWYGSNGNLQSTVTGVTATAYDTYYVTESVIILATSNSLKVITKTETSYSIEDVSTSIWAYGNLSKLPESTSYYPVVNGGQLIVYQLPVGTPTTSSGVSFVPNNAIVIPASHAGSVDVVLETSEDLVNWTPALPGTYGPNVSSRFFRVRATTVE